MDQNNDKIKTLPPGTKIGDHYEITKCLGFGSMGVIYAGRHLHFNSVPVAIKVLYSDIENDTVLFQRFKQEVNSFYLVNHENVVRSFEYIKEGDLIAFTMEFVGGGTLAQQMYAENPIPLGQAVRYLKQICAGTNAIHKAGIIHRDLKPENIMLTEKGDVKITDFGVALTGEGPRLTAHGGVIGTLDYLSPEYLEQGVLDHRADIYSIGVIGYEMIAKRKPFKGNSVIDTVRLKLRSMPEPLVDLNPACSPELEQIILKALRSKPDDRYQNVQQMLYDLERVDAFAEGETPKSAAPRVRVTERSTSKDEINVEQVSGTQSIANMDAVREAVQDSISAASLTAIPRKTPVVSSFGKVESQSNVSRGGRSKRSIIPVIILALLALALGGVGFLFAKNWQSQANEEHSSQLSLFGDPNGKNSKPAEGSKSEGDDRSEGEDLVDDGGESPLIPVATASPTPSATPKATAKPTFTPVPTRSPSPTRTPTPTPTRTVVPVATPAPSLTSPTPVGTATNSGAAAADPGTGVAQILSARRVKQAGGSYASKAEVLYHTMHHAVWLRRPPEEVVYAAVQLCLVGANSFGDELDRLKSKGAVEDEFTFTYLSLGDKPSLDSLKSCHVVYLSATVSESIIGLAAALLDAGVLVVSDRSGVGAVTIVRSNDKYLPAISADRSKRAGVYFSPGLN